MNECLDEMLIFRREGVHPGRVLTCELLREINERHEENVKKKDAKYEGNVEKNNKKREENMKIIITRIDGKMVRNLMLTLSIATLQGQ